jgi:hypothetical protein
LSICSLILVIQLSVAKAREEEGNSEEKQHQQLVLPLAMFQFLEFGQGIDSRDKWLY